MPVTQIDFNIVLVTYQKSENETDYQIIYEKEKLENIGSRIDMQTHAGSSSARP